MLQTLWGEVKQGKIELLELTELPEGSKVLITLLPTAEATRWLQAPPSSNDTIWDNIESPIQVSTLSE